MKDYYKILEIASDASDEDIKRAYRRLAKKYHPDQNPEAAALFRDVAQAYETLKDEGKRADYDLRFQNQKKERPKTADTGSKRNRHFSPNDFANTSNLFEDFFGFSPTGGAGAFDSGDKDVKPMKTKDAFEHIFGKGRF